MCGASLPFMYHRMFSRHAFPEVDVEILCLSKHHHANIIISESVPLVLDAPFPLYLIRLKLSADHPRG